VSIRDNNIKLPTEKDLETLMKRGDFKEYKNWSDRNFKNIPEKGIGYKVIQKVDNMFIPIIRSNKYEKWENLKYENIENDWVIWNIKGSSKNHGFSFFLKLEEAKNFYDSWLKEFPNTKNILFLYKIEYKKGLISYETVSCISEVYTLIGMCREFKFSEKIEME